MAMSTSKEKGGRIEGSAKAHVADQISQAVQSTSNLLHLMHQSSPSQALLIKLPKNLLAKASTVKNTGQVLERMPRVISSLDAHMENGLRRRNRANSHRVRLEKDVHATKPQVVGDKHLGMACIWCYNLPKITVNSP
ncbi:hypothetical protein MRB53_003506 [Persea americana]|uniref:Uncharacterized protein n=1 Tax=Persea americana TaxID=3435 RepID=A0ACC2MXV3_PERAE|nr:hypothetical protein MRB53_003506 [Persea americana]